MHTVCYWLCVVGLFGGGSTFVYRSASKRAGAAPSAEGLKASAGRQSKGTVDAVVGKSLEAESTLHEPVTGWEVLHGLLAFGGDLRIEQDGNLVGGLTYLLHSGNFHQPVFDIKQNGYLPLAYSAQFIGEGDGHFGQFLYVFYLMGLGGDDEIYDAGGARFPLKALLLLRALNSLHMMVTCFYSAAYRTDFSWK